MDQITLAIITALAKGVTDATLEGTRSAAKYLYEKLRNLIRKKYGESSDINQAIDDLEANPESVNQQKVLEEQVSRTVTENDSDLVELARELIANLPSSIHVVGDGNVIGNNNQVNTIHQRGGDGSVQIGEVQEVNLHPKNKAS